MEYSYNSMWKNIHSKDMIAYKLDNINLLFLFIMFLKLIKISKNSSFRKGLRVVCADMK